MRPSARSSVSSVRSGPTSSAIVACKRCSISAVFGASFGPMRIAIRSTVARAASGRTGTPACISLTRSAAVRPACTAEHQCLGDGVAGQPVGAVGAADRFARDQQARHLGLHPHVGLHAAHVIVRDRRHLDRLLGEIDAVRRQPVDHRAERLAQLRLRHVLEAEIGAAVRRAAAGLDLLDDRVGADDRG